jgi:hypothetical protein
VSNLVHHPCELVTEHELDDIAGVSYAPGSPVASAKNDYSYCDYAPLNPERQTGVNLIVSTGSVASALPPKSFGNTYYSVGSVGHDATYVVEKGAAKGYGELFFELGTIGSTTINVQIQMFHGSLSEGAEIAKQCLANL